MLYVRNVKAKLTPHEVRCQYVCLAPFNYHSVLFCTVYTNWDSSKQLLFFFTQNFMKNIDDEIQATKQQIEQLTHRQDHLVSKLKVEERKKRTRLLIERGAILESEIGNSTHFSNEQIQALLVEIFSNAETREKVERIREQNGNEGNPLF